jgi:hypothetical protein
MHQTAKSQVKSGLSYRTPTCLGIPLPPNLSVPECTGKAIA